MDTDQRRLILTAEVQVVQLDCASGLKLVFGHRAKTPRGDAALRDLQFMLGSQNFADSKNPSENQLRQNQLRMKVRLFSNRVAISSCSTTRGICIFQRAARVTL